MSPGRWQTDSACPQLTGEASESPAQAARPALLLGSWLRQATCLCYVRGGHAILCHAWGESGSYD